MLAAFDCSHLPSLLVPFLWSAGLSAFPSEGSQSCWLIEARCDRQRKPPELVARSIPSFQESSGVWFFSLYLRQGTQGEKEEDGAIAGGTRRLNGTSM